MYVPVYRYRYRYMSLKTKKILKYTYVMWPLIVATHVPGYVVSQQILIYYCVCTGTVVFCFCTHNSSAFSDTRTLRVDSTRVPY